MNVQVENLANSQLVNIYYYNLQFSLKSATTIALEIRNFIEYLEEFPYTGRYIPEMSDKRFRELIYKYSKHSTYRIMYFISQKNNTIYVFNIMNCKQDFNRILRLHNYFNNYLDF